MQTEMGMVVLGGPGSLVNYEEFSRSRSVSLGEWVHLVATSGPLMINFLLQLRRGLSFQPENNSPFHEDSTCYQVNFFKKERRTKGKDFRVLGRLSDSLKLH